MQTNTIADRSTYKVVVGYWSAHLTCQSRHEAIEVARRMLAEEFPQLWDEVHQLTPERFSVEPAMLGD